MTSTGGGPFPIPGSQAPTIPCSGREWVAPSLLRISAASESGSRETVSWQRSSCRPPHTGVCDAAAPGGPRRSSFRAD